MPDLLKFSRTPGNTRTERLKRNPMLTPHDRALWHNRNILSRRYAANRD